jgi:hypothetical protein
VREALATYVTEHRRTTADVPAFVGAARSGYRDTADRHEEILFDDLEPHQPGQPAVPLSRRGNRR